MPFAPGSFEGAYLFHVGMNIENKAQLFAEIRRVLAPSGVFLRGPPNTIWAEFLSRNATWAARCASRRLAESGRSKQRMAYMVW